MHTCAWLSSHREEDWEEELAIQNAFLPVDYFFMCPLHTLKYPANF